MRPSHITKAHKPAGVRCEHQRFGKGCNRYADRPTPCRIWNCRWLLNADTADQSRPDHSHVVIDTMPDFVVCNDGSGDQHVEAVQVWVDPKYPDAHRAPAIRAYMQRRALEGKVTLVRVACGKTFTVIAPSMMANGEWAEVEGEMVAQGETWPEEFGGRKR